MIVEENTGKIFITQGWKWMFPKSDIQRQNPKKNSDWLYENISMRYRKHYKQSQKTKSTCLYYKRDIIQEVYKINKGIVNTLAEKQRQIINGQ